MEANPVAASPSTARHGDLNPGAAPNSPERSRRQVAQCRARATRKNRGHPAPVPRQEARADRRVDAAVERMESSNRDPVLKRAAFNTEL
jgi:hypothetical protein